jgi:tetratricopeptide (TPR) repeat protein
MNPSPMTEVFGKAKVLALAGALSLVAVPSVANAEPASTDVSRAENYAAEAFSAYEKKDYQEAVVLYLKALEAAPSADVLFNLAKIYDTKLNDRQLAMSFYRRYIADPGAEPDRVRVANARLAELRELEAAASEKPAAVAATAAVGEQQKGSPPAKSSGPGGDSTVPPAADHGLSGMQWAGIATGIVGLGGVAVGTVFGFSAKSDADIANQECNGNDCRTQRGVDAAKDAATKADVSTASFIAGGALIAVGTVLLLTGGSSAPTEGPTANFRITPYAGLGSLGTQVSGRF